jgi:hypothetical protein
LPQSDTVTTDSGQFYPADLRGLFRIGSLVMRTPLEIRNDALECLRQAGRVPARRHKAVLLILAQGWASLADELERAAPLAEDDATGEIVRGGRPHLHPANAN